MSILYLRLFESPVHLVVGENRNNMKFLLFLPVFRCCRTWRRRIILSSSSSFMALVSVIDWQLLKNHVDNHIQKKYIALSFGSWISITKEEYFATLFIESLLQKIICFRSYSFLQKLGFHFIYRRGCFSKKKKVEYYTKTTATVANVQVVLASACRESEKTFLSS